jgi:hypothetical protein
MQLDPEVEAAQAETERKEIDLTDEDAVKPIVDLVNAGVITPEYARDVLGIPQEKNRSAREGLDVAAGLFAGDGARDALCDECAHFEAEVNRCTLREIERRFDEPACRYFERDEETAARPAAEATGQARTAQECVACR